MTTKGFRAPQVCNLVGITYRQLDYWARTGLITPSLQEASGSGTQRLYSFTDVIQLKVIKRLKDAGMSLTKIRLAIKTLRNELGVDSLSDITILVDGSSIVAAKSPSEVVDVLQRGQGVFGLAVAPLRKELEAEIDEVFPAAEVIEIPLRSVEAL